ncbi:TasA family protein [Rathayibacter toxicus]|uniref:Peptidase n=1 Tax=Rathayibacter toxicus TaxID=145458 RepID=A0A2S5Y9L3_9MICO|nr:TasA family protein [Rathayibacter toxicus]PPH25288.1 peptidase [Rathayibacter toxicus]PPH58534.1 peptidase [Rathayibacter toxicus]PPH61162.1 peptidase [Rathayibacter toxicus]PPH89050.1 peptidase [Rathayibacter toxicus]PPI16840.1 peptidase [Rathayibacter toxicus]
MTEQHSTPQTDPLRPVKGHAVARHTQRGSMTHRSLFRAGLALIAAVALALGVGVGASALFGDNASRGAGVGAGKVVAAFTATGATTVNVSVSGLVPGGTARRLLDLSNVGTIAIAALQLQTSADGTSSSDWVQLTLERCSQPWSSDASTCAGSVTTVSNERPIAAARINLPGSPALAVGATDHLRLTLRLPESSPIDAQGSAGTVSITAIGVQRTGRQL